MLELTKWYERDRLRRPYFASFFLKNKILKSLLYSDKFSLHYKLYWYICFINIPKKSSIGFYRRGCELTGNSRSVFRLFKLSRYSLKKLASHGSVQGLRKSSF